MHQLRLHQCEPLQGGFEDIYVPFHSVEHLKYLWERLPKGAILRVQVNVFPPTMTKALINLQLEVITLIGEDEE